MFFQNSIKLDMCKLILARCRGVAIPNPNPNPFFVDTGSQIDFITVVTEDFAQPASYCVGRLQGK